MWDPQDAFIENLSTKIYYAVPAFIGGVIVGTILWAFYILLYKTGNCVKNHAFRNNTATDATNAIEVKEVLIYNFFYHVVKLTLACYSFSEALILALIKGQLISKGHFGFFNSPKKRTKNFCPSRLVQKLTFSSLILGKLKTLKFPFEIN